MPPENSPRQSPGYIDVDSLQRELVHNGNVVERIADFYNLSLPELHRKQNETRMACFFACGKPQETGDRAISVKTKADGVLFRCFQYGCTVRGNLLHLMYVLKHNRQPSGDKLKGPEFKEIAQDLQTLVEGRPLETPSTPTPETFNEDDSPLNNPPLKDSENERARALVNLDEQFITDVAEMSPAAAKYVRQRPFMTQEAMQTYRCGYLPQSAKGLLRGHFVYGYPDEDGNILSWFGRNLHYEEQYKKWYRFGDSSREPQKFKFVKGFHRGQELFGFPEYLKRANPELIKITGIVLAEGPNDVMNLHRLGIPALAVCSNMITEKQAEKLAEMASAVPGGFVSVMFDLDQEGQKGAKQAVLELAKRCCVKLAWTTNQFNGRQPEMFNSAKSEITSSK